MTDQIIQSLGQIILALTALAILHTAYRVFVRHDRSHGWLVPAYLLSAWGGYCAAYMPQHLTVGIVAGLVGWVWGAIFIERQRDRRES